VDAPHGAPSQHVYRYRTCMLVGAGIGVTPCASIMKGVIGFRWKKGFSPSHLHFFWVARRSDLTTFKWLLLLLPQLKAQELKHNDHYGGDERQLQAMESRVKILKHELSELSGSPPGSAAALPPGWAESKTDEGHTYYWNTYTNESSWVRPQAAPSPRGDNGERVAKEAELLRTQARAPSAPVAPREWHYACGRPVSQDSLVAASAGNRSLTITLCLTGCKPEDVKPDPTAPPESQAGLITSLLASEDPVTKKPHVIIKAGRPKWDAEFSSISEKYSTMYGKEEIGVVFCGAPLIAAALKEQCETKSSSDGVLFRLHKENF